MKMLAIRRLNRLHKELEKARRQVAEARYECQAYQQNSGGDTDSDEALKLKSKLYKAQCRLYLQSHEYTEACIEMGVSPSQY